MTTPQINEVTTQNRADVREKSAEQEGGLERAALALANTHTTAAHTRRSAPLLKRIENLAVLLQKSYQHFLGASESELAEFYAAEWMLDNYYVIEQALRLIKEDLPETFYRQLPKLDDGPDTGYPRIFAIARAFAQMEDGIVDMARFKRFVRAYQQQHPLTMGEVWGLPIMLRFVLLESIGQATGRLVQNGKLLPSADSPLHIDYNISDEQVVANCIPGLRLLDSQDWKEFFEEISLVHHLLCQDPAGIYGRMDFTTRDHYRGEIEELALAAGEDEVEIARIVLEMAVSAAHGVNGAGSEIPAGDALAKDSHAPWYGLHLPRETHIGYYLIDAGRAQLEKRIGYQPRGLQRGRRWMLAHPTAFYLGSISTLTLFIVAAIVAYAVAQNGVLLAILAAGLVALIPAVTIAVSLVNTFVTRVLPPRRLPKLDLEEGIPAACETMLVIPVLISSPDDVESLFRQLELHYLRNPDPHLSFALLSDFSDAPEETMPEDEALLDAARTRLEALNAKYPSRPFCFFHRRRLWNPAQNTWMGWERKRGKLHEFNRLLRGDETTSYMMQLCDKQKLAHVRYVITLDADTVLPTGEANRLIGTLAHPLNRAEFDEETGKVRAGYTVLQPRTAIKPTSASQSLFSRVFAGDAGIDLYSLAVSDVYQDLFGAGIFVGKGIYDVDAFERSLEGRVPENTILSHDLFEGIHGRAGLVTDIVLYEEYPPHYLINVLRSHRWVRGDWQLLPWLRRWVPYRDEKIRNDLSLIDRWKIIDNLRRSLLSPALLLLFVAGWTILPGTPLFWTLVGLITPAVPLITGLFTATLRGISGDSWQQSMEPVRDNSIRWLLFIAFLPYESLLLLDAIATTLVRLFFTRRNLLEWTTADRTVRLFGDEVTVTTTFMKMLPALLLVAVLVLLVAWVNLSALLVAAPFLLVWLFAFEIAHRISRPDPRPEQYLTEEQQTALRRLARHTWLFYEQFVGPDDNWLPPDHFQESPKGVVAHRTSPTNIGLYLLTALAAHDFGYVGVANLALRLRSTFDTLGRMDRHRGHFLNWIDTRNLAPLPPSYVSTVDSGNLAACFIALKQGCLALPQQPIWGWARWQGLLDALSLLDETVHAMTADIEDDKARPLRAHLAEMQARIRQQRHEPESWYALLTTFLTEDVPALNQQLVSAIEQFADHLDVDMLRSCRIYADRVHYHLDGMRRELDQLTPWLSMLAQPPAAFTSAPSPTGDAELEDADGEDASGKDTAAWEALVNALPTTPSLADIGPACVEGQTHLAALRDALETLPVSHEDASAAREWCNKLSARLEEAASTAASLIDNLHQLAHEADVFVDEMDFSFLYDPVRHVFRIGFNLDTGELDNNYYDLLASEVRITSLVAIAKRDVPQSHWLHLGRPLTRIENGTPVLLSWSGTMFEYLMPPLLLRSYDYTLLGQSCRASVQHQIAYGKEKGVPWGISESGFYEFDASSNYQYRAFGAPGLGFKRGLSEDLVVTPYASLLALEFDPQAVLENMRRLQELGMLGRYGFFEAIDFTKSRLNLGQEYAIIRSYMAHHQGMIMLSIVNRLCEETMIHRFHAEPTVQSVELLLQEQVPGASPFHYPHKEESDAVLPSTSHISIEPWSPATNTPMPLVHYLSNGSYSLLLTNDGGGYSQYEETALTRWRADTTQDDWGTWIYVQDLESGALWSATQQPTGARPDHYDVAFHPHMVEFRRRDHGISLHQEVVVAPHEDVEIRRISLSNTSDRTRRLRLTSYGEVALAPASADQSHPAFAKLFVESEYVAEEHMLLFRRRPRSADEKHPFLGHMLVVSQESTPPAYESDRAQFLGRNRTIQQPSALCQPDAKNGLTGTTGATLDPIFALGQEIELEPHASVQLAFVTLAANSENDARALAQQYSRWVVIERAMSQARTEAEKELRELNLATPDLEHYQKLLSLLLYPHAAKRAAADILRENRKGQSGLWAYGISGDYPILLLEIQNESQGELLQDLLQAHTYWRRRGLRIDLVILNRQGTNYNQPVQGFVHRLVQRTGSGPWLNQRGGIFIVRQDQMSQDDYVLLRTAARVVLDARDGSLGDQLAQMLNRTTPLPAFNPTMHGEAPPAEIAPVERRTDLIFDNGWGGFTEDGREYVIYVEPDNPTPAPWINVIANPEFGFLISESGGGYTWAANSGENRLTAWRNDPVSDMPAEAIYLRDEETADLWSPMPQPMPSGQPYRVRHGAGYTIFEHNSHGLRQSVRLFAAMDAPVKIVRLRLENPSDRARRVTATYYAEWVLGTNRQVTQQYIVSDYAQEDRAILARNRYNAEFGERVAFLSSLQEPHGLTADRTEFLGRRGRLARPDALTRIGLDNRLDAGQDPCAALQVHVDLPPGGTEDVYFLLGQGENEQQSLEIIRHYRAKEQIDAAWHAVHDTWNYVLDRVQVETPDKAMNCLLNRWLLYQALSSRIWGRSALYQSSGAFGFRDQLQDVMALIHARPDLTREQILRAARHQFEAGDVLHWWHPPSGRGVRTRITDDLLWLPYVTAHYVAATGDESVLYEEAPFLRGDPLSKEEEERYAEYATTAETYTILEHCCRALRRGTTAGRHGIPLMGAGDWNDGMNRVGIEGEGESIWLGWFLYATLRKFAEMCDRLDERDRADAYRADAARIREALEYNGWDGAWYRRAYYDDGTPLGSAQNKECRIDSIAQSWSVLSGGADPDRARQAMDSVRERLVREADRLILLFTPPLDKTPKDPGYIKGYLPGVRENGGQYTHAALWTIWAFAEMGEGDRAEALFRMINPIYRADSPEKAAIYKVEPYVISADVYGVEPHVGRGGWTWYTGSSGWMYRLGLEAILGVRRINNHLRIEPSIPATWDGFAVTYRYGSATYHIRVENPDGVNQNVAQIHMDDAEVPDGLIPLHDDGAEHFVHVRLG